MIIRQALNFGVNLVAGTVLSAFAVGVMRACRCASRDRLEPRYPPAPEPPSAAPAGETPSESAAI
jgi:hypothetical protein